jgi:hypothetical protein
MFVYFLLLEPKKFRSLYLFLSTHCKWAESQRLFFVPITIFVRYVRFYLTKYMYIYIYIYELVEEFIYVILRRWRCLAKEFETRSSQQQESLLISVRWSCGLSRVSNSCDLGIYKGFAFLLGVCCWTNNWCLCGALPTFLYIGKFI